MKTESDSTKRAVPTPVEQDVVEITERDIVFDCPNCGGELVVDKEGEGLQVPCTHCGTSVTVPKFEGPSERASGNGLSTNAPVPVDQLQFQEFSAQDADELRERRDHLERLYRENKSQRVEVTSYINQTTIQLHRYQLRLQKLQTRQHDLEGEVEAIDKQLERRGSA